MHEDTPHINYVVPGGAFSSSDHSWHSSSAAFYPPIKIMSAKIKSRFEFIRRFVQHVLPTGFMKIRYYGFMHPSTKIPLKLAVALPEADGAGEFQRLITSPATSNLLQTIEKSSISHKRINGSDHGFLNIGLNRPQRSSQSMTLDCLPFRIMKTRPRKNRNAIIYGRSIVPALV